MARGNRVTEARLRWFLCDGPDCRRRGARRLWQIAHETSGSPGAVVVRTECLGLCPGGPFVWGYPAVGPIGPLAENRWRDYWARGDGPAKEGDSH
ncbi:hypothetical protein Sulac_1463 [Sulfobacillus acidophilus DSM 10332]|uniref:(2Fe-2S) ferredoxin domain-containing protein n=1 Tax=Sulfobacillus acidophilus (strain ATCC 700253 / DSM 10332 / NAL) TaxID=679936 RepID=G8TX52_SULAD|nr:hypothetical protein Sulac_1463 [Sulfobacillus acidophilus DSM 10332]